MGKTEHCRSESTDFEISDSIQRSGKLSPLAKSINVPSFRVGNALGLFTPYLNDVFLAAQILRGYYQPAGPLISSHFVGPQNLSKSSTSLLEADPRGISSQQSAASTEPSENELLIAGDDELQRSQHTFRYPPAPPSQQQPALPLALAVPAPSARYLHPMHCAPYPPSYYTPYGQHPQDICYPPYQPSPYYTGPYRRYLASPSAYYPSPPGGHMQAPTPMPQPPPPNATGPQHIDPYPPYCSGFSPGGGQCYTRGMQPPYMDSPPYPPNYPCPMPCPKNVHTGPLIGSKTSKGPGQTNTTHLVASHNDRGDTTTNTTTSTTSLKLSASSDATSCKVTDTVHTTATAVASGTATTKQSTIFVKPELNDDDSESSHSQQLHHHHHGGACTGGGIAIYHSNANEHCDKIGFAPQYYPNYTLNPKVLEQPEQPVSPARGSTGLPGSPSLSASEHHEQPMASSGVEVTAATTPLAAATIGRRARVGKSMAREMMMQPHLKHDANGQTIISDAGNINANAVIGELLVKQAILTDHENIPTTLIKQEDVKKEHVDGIELIAAKVEMNKDFDSIQPSSPSNKRKISTDNCDDIENLEESSLADVAPILKRQKLLKIRQNSIKLSPTCSYKSLIKPSRPKPYLCKSGRKKLRAKALYCLANAANGNSESAMARATKAKKARRKLSLLALRRPPRSSSSEKTSSSENLNALVSMDETSLTVPSNEPQSNDGQSKTDEIIELDVLDDKDESVKPPKKKAKPSHTKRTEDNVETTKKPSATTKKAQPAAEDVDHLSKTSSKSQAKSKSKKQAEASDAIDDTESTEQDTALTSEPKSKAKCSSKSKANASNLNAKLQSSDTIGLNNNNNSLLFDKNNCIDVNQSQHQHLEAMDDALLDGASDVATTSPPTSRPITPTPSAAKKSKSRGNKFSNKKRHRMRCVQEIPEAILPRRSMTSPRWSNGWKWEGEPFQSKVFLNSDEHQVFRTRYSAMKHDTGDIIRPGDCVLLRAGSKKNELPYVAKVASLWENPEDGEMMMSLFWYYRPEHTEQGRQSTDCPDEVFASKHLDHNSVACIEDKCYVLTFNEYCRYRKTIKSIEEGVEMVPSIVPQLNEQIDREIPLNTNSELILFCRRVYDFRLKRLIKNPS